MSAMNKVMIKYWSDNEVINARGFLGFWDPYNEILPQRANQSINQSINNC